MKRPLQIGWSALPRRGPVVVGLLAVVVLALVAFLVTSAYAATDEFHQTFVEGRHGKVFDWLIDSAGAAAVAIRLGVLRRRRRIGA